MQLRFLVAPAGVRLGYVESGTGPAFVRVPNWGYHVESWVTGGMPGEFRAWAHGRRFVSGDARGVGASQRDEINVSLDALIADFGALVERVEVESFDLFGSTWRGALATDTTVGRRVRAQGARTRRAAGWVWQTLAAPRRCVAGQFPPLLRFVHADEQLDPGSRR